MIVGIVVVVFLLLCLFGAIILLPLLLPLALIGTTGLTTPLPAPGVVPLPAVESPVGPLPASPDLDALQAIIAPWLGVPYVFGGNTLAGVDCSGFSLAVARAQGINLPRTAQGQWDVMQHVSQADARPGDFVFFHSTYDSRPDFISHVGIYVGSGWQVSAVVPRLGRQNLSDAYWRAHLVGYARFRR